MRRTLGSADYRVSVDVHLGSSVPGSRDAVMVMVMVLPSRPRLAGHACASSCLCGLAGEKRVESLMTVMRVEAPLRMTYSSWAL